MELTNVEPEALLSYTNVLVPFTSVVNSLLFIK